MKIVYGPVSSWRLERSLGVDLICQESKKVCTFDCIYCSLGKTTEKTIQRREFVDLERMAEELRKALREVEPDFVTFSGTGEPTLAQNLGEAIKIAREISSLPIAVLTNSSLKNKKDVRRDLAEADVVVGSLDASNEKLFREVNQPHKEIYFDEIVRGMKKFREEFNGKFSLEVMFVPENRDFSKEIAKVAKTIKPDEVQINTPLRSSPIKPLTLEELSEVQKDFDDMNFRSVYEAEKSEVGKTVGQEKLRKLKRPENKSR